MLAVERFGEGTPMVALHGFSHTGAQFSSLRIPGRTIIAPDLPGHGGSAAEPTDAGATVSAIADLLASFASPTPLLGYSQGARLALSVATTAPQRPSALIVISGTAGLKDPDERARRRDSDAELGERIRAMGIEAFIDQWTSSGLTDTAALPVEERAADRARRLTNTADGLASALDGYGQGALDPVWSLLATLEMPVLILTGERDPRYTAIGAELAAAIGGTAEHQVIHGAGHNLVGEQPRAVSAIVSGFLDGLG